MGRPRCGRSRRRRDRCVERAGAGDDTRGWGPPLSPRPTAVISPPPISHGAQPRQAPSVDFDFETEDGRRIVKKLAARSDVLIENYKVGDLAKFGLDYELFSKGASRLIYCSVTGFRADGPLCRAPATT